MKHYPCDTCGREDALPMPQRPGNLGYLCPTCAARAAAEDAAAAHLHALLLPVLGQWARHWGAAGVRPSALASLLSLEGLYWHPLGALVRENDPNPERHAAQVLDEATR